jgi:hypothetical protein
MEVRGTIRSTAAIAAVSLLLIACGFNRSPQSQAPPDTRDPDPVPAATSAAKTPAPEKTTNRPKAGTLHSRSTAQTQQRVSCTGIQTELKLVADDGPVDWTSRVVDRWTSTSVGNTISSVTVTPASGTLASGASVTPTIRGTYPADKQRFWVLFDYPTSAGSASVTFEVSC